MSRVNLVLTEYSEGLDTRISVTSPDFNSSHEHEELGVIEIDCQRRQFVFQPYLRWTELNLPVPVDEDSFVDECVKRRTFDVYVDHSLRLYSIAKRKIDEVCNTRNAD